MNLSQKKLQVRIHIHSTIMYPLLSHCPHCSLWFKSFHTTFANLCGSILLIRYRIRNLKQFGQEQGQGQGHAQGDE